jgi:hypothetical protein
MDLKINPYFTRELLENILSQSGFFYIANKSNKKKIKDFFNSMPFFFFGNKEQTILYTCIKNNNITSHLDKKENMQKLCYNIYRDFCVMYKMPFKSYDDFYNNLKFKLYSNKFYMQKIKNNNIHTIIFILFVLILIFTYYITTKDNIKL